jgi:hypothetical protein
MKPHIKEFRNYCGGGHPSNANHTKREGDY